MDLILIRHGAAGSREPAAWPDDAERPLTPEGERRFRAAARGLRTLAPSVDAVLSSPFARAWRTAELLEEHAGWPAPIRCDELASGTPPEDVVPILEGRSGLGAVALVGHEPHLHELASLLLAGDADGLVLQLKKGGVACLSFGEEPAPGAAQLGWLLTPRVLRALG